MPDLYRELIKLAESDMYPFHMPGHKRNDLSTPLKGAFRCDITEIDGFDNLHDESGIILEAEERANRLYGADKTFFLVNGSTSGVLTAISAAVPRGGKILASRGSHKSFYNAAYLRELNICYLPNKVDKSNGMPDRYNVDDIEFALEEAGNDIQALFITSPTYEGKCSDIRGIADLCHKRGIPLIVDAAHGAHFGMGNKKPGAEDTDLFCDLPESAISQGADIVVHSVHKTLPSMTQTALLHVNGNIVDISKIKRFLRIYQTSSPSYVFMASIDLCIKEMAEHGNEFVDKLLDYRNLIQNATANCDHIKVLGKKDSEDAAKVIISVKDTPMTGQQLYDILREEYALQLEMAGETYALAIISGWDTSEGIDRLIKAICEIDKRIESKGTTREITPTEYNLPSVRYNISTAWDMEKELIELSESEGRISGDFVNLYPPGIPIIAPGEVISQEIIKSVKSYINEGLNVQGIFKQDSNDLIKEGIICVKQK